MFEPTRPIWIYYHVSDHPGWEEMIREKVLLMQAHGLWDSAQRIHFQLHYHPESYTEWLQTEPFLQKDARISYTLYHQQVADTSYAPSFKPMGETYSVIELAEDCAEWAPPHNAHVFRYSTKGLTHRHDETWPTALAWNQYIDYWTIEQWRSCVEALEQGWDTSGANWHNGCWSGTVFWAQQAWIRSLPRFLYPHDSQVLFGKQLNGFSPRHDAEHWIGQGMPKYYELNHYEHAVVYHVTPPNPKDYRHDQR